MIWLTWRQFRAQSFVALAVLAVSYGVTGPRLAHRYDTSGLITCHAHGDCSDLTRNFLTAMKSDSVYPLLFFLGIAILYLAPALIGISGVRGWSPGSWKPAPSGWPGIRASPAPAG
jgi:hypothetical protein